MPSRCVCRFARSSDAAADSSAASRLSPTCAPGLLAQVLGRASPHAQAVGRPAPRPQLLAARGSFLEGVHRPSNCARTSGRTRCPAHVPAPLCQRAARQRPLALLAFCQDAPTTHNPSRCAQMGRVFNLGQDEPAHLLQVVRPGARPARSIPPQRSPAFSAGFRRPWLASHGCCTAGSASTAGYCSPCLVAKDQYWTLDLEHS